MIGIRAERVSLSTVKTSISQCSFSKGRSSGRRQTRLPIGCVLAIEHYGTLNKTSIAHLDDNAGFHPAYRPENGVVNSPTSQYPAVTVDGSAEKTSRIKQSVASSVYVADAAPDCLYGRHSSVVERDIVDVEAGSSILLVYPYGT